MPYTDKSLTGTTTNVLLTHDLKVAPTRYTSGTSDAVTHCFALILMIPRSCILVTSIRDLCKS